MNSLESTSSSNVGSGHTMADEKNHVAFDSRLPPQKISATLNKKFVRNFTPAYFAAVMGTGMCANLLYTFPYPAHWLRVCASIFGVISVTIFAALCVLMTMALVSQGRSLVSRIHTDPTCAPFMGCFVMGYSTLVSFLHAVLEKRAIVFVYVLWWLVAILSVYTALVTFFFSSMGKHRKRKNLLDTASLSLASLLPVVTLTVAAAVGGLITPDLPLVHLQVITMTVCFVMWSVAMVLASIITTVNFWRLFVHKIPHSGQVFTMFLPLGFLGQGSFAILLFGNNGSRLLFSNHESVAASSYVSSLQTFAGENGVLLTGLPVILAAALQTICGFVALMLVSFAYFYTFIAFFSLLSKMSPFAVKRNTLFVYSTCGKTRVCRLFDGLLTFNKGFWSMTFPIGTVSLASSQFYRLFHGFEAFRCIGAIYAVLTVAITIGCLVGVLYEAIRIVQSAFCKEQNVSEMA